jgi:hypothetical protein
MRERIIDVTTTNKKDSKETEQKRLDKVKMKKPRRPTDSQCNRSRYTFLYSSPPRPVLGNREAAGCAKY